TIRIPAYMFELLSKWRKAKTKLQDELGRPPTNEEVARSLNLSEKKLRIIQKGMRIFEAAQQNHDADSGTPLEESVMDNRTKTPETDLVQAENRRYLLGLLDQVSPREATVLRLRFGLDDQEPKTFQEIAGILGVTRERVRQIENEALNKLSAGLR